MITSEIKIWLLANEETERDRQTERRREGIDQNKNEIIQLTIRD